MPNLLYSGGILKSMAQTDKDPRILVAQLALEKLGTALFSKSTVRPDLNRDQTQVLLSEIESQLMALKFSYLEPAEMAVSQMVSVIFDRSKELYLGYKEALASGITPLPRANILWAFTVLSGLKNRFGNSGTKSTHGIDIVAVRIRNIAKNGDLFTTKCVAGPNEFTIVTNMNGLKSGDTLAAALLPPAVVGGAVSEAMFLGSEKMKTEPGSFIDHETVKTKEADGILFNELRGL